MPLGRLIAFALLAVGAVWTAILPAHAAEPFPARQITLVVPLTPGTTIDILARLYADKLGKLLGQQIVVLNRPGASSAPNRSRPQRLTAIRCYLAIPATRSWDCSTRTWRSIRSRILPA